jgi:hypothetical protein
MGLFSLSSPYEILQTCIHKAAELFSRIPAGDETSAKPAVA